MIVLDASVLIAYLDGDDPQHLRAERLLDEAVDDDLGVNPLTLAEVLVGPARAGRIGAVTKVFDDLGVEEIAFPADTGVLLAQLRADTGLKLPDCCVLLAAEQRTAGVAAFDTRLAQAARARGLPALGR